MSHGKSCKWKSQGATISSFISKQIEQNLLVLSYVQIIDKGNPTWDKAYIILTLNMRNIMLLNLSEIAIVIGCIWGIIVDFLSPSSCERWPVTTLMYQSSLLMIFILRANCLEIKLLNDIYVMEY